MTLKTELVCRIHNEHVVQKSRRLTGDVSQTRAHTHTHTHHRPTTEKVGLLSHRVGRRFVKIGTAAAVVVVRRRAAISLADALVHVALELTA